LKGRPGGRGPRRARRSSVPSVSCSLRSEPASQSCGAAWRP